MTVEVLIRKSLLRDRRIAAGYTQEQLARMIGVSKTRISEYENEPINMTITTAKKLAVACNCEVDELFDFTIGRRRG